MDHTELIPEQGKALGRAIEALETIKPSGPVEHTMVSLLLHRYRRRLRGSVGTAPAWVAEEILGASHRIGEDRPAVWLSEN